VVGLAWLNDPESYAGSSAATSRASHARKVEGDDPDKKEYPGPPGWGLGMGLTTSPIKSVLLRSFQSWKPMATTKTTQHEQGFSSGNLERAVSV
jgi:hypothetical protein